MTHGGPFQPLPFCDSVIYLSSILLSPEQPVSPGADPKY